MAIVCTVIFSYIENNSFEVIGRNLLEATTTQPEHSHDSNSNKNSV